MSTNHYAYYNEIDPYCVEWLNNLMTAGLIMEGEIDCRSIKEVQPEDLRGFTRCHFFAGIAGWDYALKLADWSVERSVWTGSCPCQPFSVAGRGARFADTRHLWPAWFRLIQKCKPTTVLGEQVAAALDWLDLVCSDMESEDYAIGAVDLPACSIGSEAIRQRLWFVANAGGERLAGSVRERKGVCSVKGPASAERSDSGVFEGVFDVPYPADLPAPHGIPRPVGQLRAYGNAIVPQVAAEFIKAYLATEE